MEKKFRTKGEIYLLLSGFFFGLQPFFAKTIYAHGGDAYSLLVLRFLISGAVFAAIYTLLERRIWVGQSIWLSREEFISILILSVPEVIMCMLLFLSYSYISSGLASTLHFSYPAAVILLELLIFRKKISKIKLLCLLFCAIGIAVFYQPDGNINILGMVMALASGVGYAIYIIVLTHGKAGKIPVIKMSAWLSFLLAIEIAIVMLLSGKFRFQMDATAIGMSVFMAAVISTLALATFQIGAPMCGAQTAALLSTIEPVSSILLGVIFLGEHMSLRIFVGICFILMSIVIQIKEKKE